MKTSEHRRFSRRRWFYGNIVETTYGTEIKTYSYRGIKLLQYNYLTKQLIFYDWKVGISRMGSTKIYSSPFYRKIKTGTVRGKYQYCMPPNMLIRSKSGVRRTFFIYVGKNALPILLTDGLTIPYDGVT